MRGRAAARLYRSSSVAAAPGYGVASLFVRSCERSHVITKKDENVTLVSLISKLNLNLRRFGVHTRVQCTAVTPRATRQSGHGFTDYTRMHTTLHHDVHKSTTYLLQTPHVSVLPSMEDHSGRGAAPSPRESFRKAWCYVHWQRHGPRKVQIGGPGARRSFSSQAPAALMSMAPTAAHGTLLDSPPVVAHQEPPPGSQLQAASQIETEPTLACGLSPSETAC